MQAENYKTDVVVIGAGVAGLITALQSLKKQRKVILIDRENESQLGGLARWAFGGMALVGTPEQRLYGIHDDPDIALRDWYSFANFSDTDVWPKRWAHLYVERSRPDIYDWLKRYRLRFLPAVQWVERGLYTPGNSVPRYHILWGTGWALAETFVKALMPYRVDGALTILTQHRVDSLINEQGRICGCLGVRERADRPFSVRADHVVVASGGFTGNLQKVREHWPWGQAPAKMLNGSHPFADGAMHDQVKQHGGALTHMSDMWNYAAGIAHPQPKFSGQGLSLIPCKSALWLNHRGERIGPDPLITGFDTTYLCQRVSAQEKPWTWQVLNRRIAEKELAVSGSEYNPLVRDKKFFPFLKDMLFGSKHLVSQLLEQSGDFVSADSVDELADKMNELTDESYIEKQTLLNTIQRFDDNFERGSSQYNDDQIRRIQHARAWRSDRLRTCPPRPLRDKN
ncbi:MAG TPA: FAD-dependent oxidoreductase, partial [Pseudomonadales bacterium]|nr:FAD-dependent oxidoreductase [Pseudomonadales bacterium]